MPARLTIDAYHALADRRGYTWMGPTVAGANFKTWWRCANGHEWETTYHVIQQGSGCPKCAPKKKRTPADYYVLADEHDLEWLGPEVSRTDTKTWWKCQAGHKWETTYKNIHGGRGCPACAVNRRAEALRAHPVDYHALANEYKIEWLGPEVKRARIHTWWRCQRGHKWQTTYVSIRSGSGCPICGQERRVEYLRKKPVDYHAVAARRGIEWIGLEAFAASIKTWWRCAEGHEWKTTYATIRQGHGCPICHHLYHRGEKHHCWRGGKSSYSPEFDAKRKRVCNRDANICQVCDDSEDLCVHHIDYDKTNDSDENLITLCRSCHGKTNFNRRFWQTVLSWKMGSK